MISKRQLAAERLESDIINAVHMAAARDALMHTDPQTRATRLYVIMSADSRITNAVLQQLKRNWKVTERARPARTATSE